MSTINNGKKGEHPAKELRDTAPLMDEEMSEDELAGIAAAGYIRGSSDDDFLVGTDGNDKVYGGGGEDVLMGGDGNDTLDGGFMDGEGDVALGGAGNDVFYWGPSRDGSDYFDGGDGHDSLKIDLRNTGHASAQSAFESGYLTLTIAGDPDFEPTFDESGNLILPDGVTGQITGPTGETMTFTNVEMIGKI